MACLRNIIAQKKSDIEAKASQFLENKPLEPTICAQSPVVGVNGRRMIASIERDGRSSNKSPYMCMEQTGGQVKDSVTIGNVSNVKGVTHHEDK